MKEKYKFLSKNIVLFALCSLGPKLISFFLVPLYTNCLTTYEYGIGDIISVTASLAIPLFQICISEAVLRFCFEESYSNKEILSCGLFVWIKGMIICALVVLIIKIQPFLQIKTEYLVTFYLIVFSNGLYNVVTNFLRGINRIDIMVQTSFVSTIATCSLNIIFLIPLNMGLSGFLLANYLGVFAATFWGGYKLKIWKYIEVASINSKTLKTIKKYSFPLIFNKLGWWINDLADRYIVILLLGSAVNGIYSIAYRIPTILTTCSHVFAQAWQLSAIKEFDKNDTDGFVTNMYNTYQSFLVIGCSVLILLDIPIAKMLYAKDFFGAWKYVPFLLISFVFGALSGFFESIFVAVKKTNILSISTIIGAITNILFNIILLAIFDDAIGAAVATLLSNVLIWLLRLKESRKYIVLKISYEKHIMMYCILIIQSSMCLQGLHMIYIISQCLLVLLLVFMCRKELCNIFEKGIRIVKCKINK